MQVLNSKLGITVRVSVTSATILKNLNSILFNYYSKTKRILF